MNAIRQTTHHRAMGCQCPGRGMCGGIVFSARASLPVATGKTAK